MSNCTVEGCNPRTARGTCEKHFGPWWIVEMRYFPYRPWVPYVPEGVAHAQRIIVHEKGAALVAACKADLFLSTASYVEDAKPCGRCVEFFRKHDLI